MINGTLSILATWFILALVFSGIGLSIQRLFGLKEITAGSLIKSFWIGWAAVLAMLQIWHLFYAVDVYAGSFFFLLGTSGLLWNLNSIISVLKKLSARHFHLFIVMLLFAIWLANRAMGPISLHDSGLYHLNTIQWISSYPIIPGLGNLHRRFAFNSSHFLYMALLDVGPWRNMSHHIGNGLLLLMLSFQTIRSVSKLALYRAHVKPHDIFLTLLMFPLIRHCHRHSPSTSNDLAVFIIGVVIGAELLRRMFSDKDEKAAFLDMLFIIVLSAAGAVIKLSFIVFAFSASGIAIYSFLRYYYQDKIKTACRIFGRAAFLILLFLVPWVTRSVILSGYIAFPNTMGSVNVEWKVPYKTATYTFEETRGFARQPGPNWRDSLKGGHWLLPWVKKNARNKNVLIPFLLAAAGGFFILYNRNTRNSDFLYDLIFLVPGLFSLVFWFCMAPDPRFAEVFLWYIGAGSIVLAVKQRQMETHPKLIAALLFSVALIFIPRFFMSVPNKTFAPLPKADLSMFQTDSGLVLYTPNQKGLCWISPLPCTPYPRPGLRLRTSGNIRNGFMIEPGTCDAGE